MTDAERAEQIMRFIYALRSKGVTDPAVLRAMERIDRGAFVRGIFAERAYEDTPLPIGCGQTISQPSVVALMTEALEVTPRDKVLEVGTGSGYQAAVLGEIVKDVYTVEYIEALGQEAKARLAALGYENVHVRIGDGYQGWPEYAPFNAILVTAGIDHVPQPLIDQLAPGGRMVIPVGLEDGIQDLRVIEKGADGRVQETKTIPVRFVPFLGPKRVE